MADEQPALFAVGPSLTVRPHRPTERPAPEPEPEQPAADPLLPEDAFPPGADRATFTRKLTRRHRFLIGLGWHPLARALGRALRLHPEAVADPDVRKGGPRCGTCAYRQLRGGAVRDYPKCYLDPLAVTRGQATDVRAWWPACTEYKEARCPRERASSSRPRLR